MTQPLRIMTLTCVYTESAHGPPTESPNPVRTDLVHQQAENPIQLVKNPRLLHATGRPRHSSPQPTPPQQASIAADPAPAVHTASRCPPAPHQDSLFSRMDNRARHSTNDVGRGDAARADMACAGEAWCTESGAVPPCRPNLPRVQTTMLRRLAAAWPPGEACQGSFGGSCTRAAVSGPDRAARQATNTGSIKAQRASETSLRYARRVLIPQATTTRRVQSQEHPETPTT